MPPGVASVNEGYSTWTQDTENFRDHVFGLIDMFEYVGENYGVD